MAKNTIKELKTTKRTTSFKRWFNNKETEENNLIETTKNVRNFDRLFNITSDNEVVEETTNDDNETTSETTDENESGNEGAE